QFLHGGWQHIVFNMLFLWVFGDNIEDALGHIRFVAFFLICGVAGGLLHSFVDPQSLTPTIGASGAIAGVLGGYLLLYPRARLLVLAFGFIPLRLPDLLVIGAFFAQDFLWGISGRAAVQGVAVWAHIGGFITGAILVILLKRAHIPLWQRPPGPWN
ncbi:MAG: rhomboid family intramembrane serine protease, partial [Alphaproteobacteria bacterium]|nr:rhomboid family intramembrane serine protease [Alphaproteobacteria bacterium]